MFSIVSNYDWSISPMQKFIKPITIKYVIPSDNIPYITLEVQIAYEGGYPVQN